MIRLGRSTSPCGTGGEVNGKLDFEYSKSPTIRSWTGVASIQRSLRAFLAARHRQIAQSRDWLRPRHPRFFAVHIDAISIMIQ